MSMGRETAKEIICQTPRKMTTIATVYQRNEFSLKKTRLLAINERSFAQIKILAGILINIFPSIVVIFFTPPKTMFM